MVGVRRLRSLHAKSEVVSQANPSFRSTRVAGMGRSGGVTLTAQAGVLPELKFMLMFGTRRSTRWRLDGGQQPDLVSPLAR